jgi:hypothetical protein
MNELELARRSPTVNYPGALSPTSRTVSLVCCSHRVPHALVSSGCWRSASSLSSPLLTSLVLQFCKGLRQCTFFLSDQEPQPVDSIPFPSRSVLGSIPPLHINPPLFLPCFCSDLTSRSTLSGTQSLINQHCSCNPVVSPCSSTRSTGVQISVVAN